MLVAANLCDSACVPPALYVRISQVIREVCENRVTGFAIHALILASVGMLPVLKMIPMPVVSGIFLYLGRKVMSGNGFLSRIKELVSDSTLLTPCSAVSRVGYKSALKYTAVQVSETVADRKACLRPCMRHITHLRCCPVLLQSL